MAVLIKNFGNNIEVNTLEELKKVLFDKYMNLSVSLVYTPSLSGIKKVLYVDVSCENHKLVVTNSYSSSPVQLETLFY
ncbi:hypothetical protein ACTFQF_00225 [Aliivibrio fischeri]|uniref:Uncharacterized protein n=1 Tax=Aliivibrio fischeri (strain MJ11) TaxID=388396 RepID=B5EW18_ALIFM|nr:hypothetical protein [Aliivibrio fischeri]ACH64654.1 conserved hypothetical protein [Aliivibrio fischeri MJ11]MUK37482.1 hypothetical protein [Aliivibrio fischeri]